MSHNWKAAVSEVSVTPSKMCDLLFQNSENRYKVVTTGCDLLSSRACSVDERFMEAPVVRLSCRRDTTEVRPMGWLRFRKYSF